MASKRRTDISVIGEMIDRLHSDLAVAIETDSLNEWSHAMSALADYLSERHKDFHISDDELL